MSRLKEILTAIQTLAQEASGLVGPAEPEFAEVGYAGLNDFVSKNPNKTMIKVIDHPKAVELTRLKPSQATTLRFAEELENLIIRQSSNLRLEELMMRPGPSTDITIAIRIYPDCDSITMISPNIHGASDAENFKSWGAEKWRANRNNAILVQGTNCVLEAPVAVGVHSGFFITGKGSKVIDGKITGFSGDALRATNDDVVISGCEAECAVGVFAPDFHVDLLQMFPNTKGAALKNVQVTNNNLQEWIPAEESHPLRHRAQGIVCFDGIPTNLVITGNIVKTDHYHGITLLGAQSCTIADNTVGNCFFQNDPRWPHIMIDNSKTGARSRGNVVSNNIAQAMKIDQD